MSLSEAFSLALNLHAHQTRKRAEDERHNPGIPYIAHLKSVAALVLEHGGDEGEAIAALLHDGPEDQVGQETLDEIREAFGDRVADIVEGCSDESDLKVTSETALPSDELQLGDQRPVLSGRIRIGRCNRIARNRSA